MAITTELTIKSVNALAIGVIEGTMLSAADRGNNSQRINHYLGFGYSVYFPPGIYEISLQLTIPAGTSNIKIWGDNAIIQQYEPAQRVINATQVNELEIAGLTLRSSYYDRGTTSTVNWTNEAPIFCDRCNNLRIHDNLIEGFEGGGCVIYDGDEITIADNQFRIGTWNATSPSGGDIYVYSSSGNNPSQVVITGNNCCSNSLFGIGTTMPTRHLNVTGNIVVTKDDNGNELTAYSATLRKSCIELQYNTSAANGNTLVDESQWEHIVSNNTCQGCRYAGISYQSFARADRNPVGLRGVISGNTVRYFGLEENLAAEKFVINGIFVDQFRDVIISDNTIVDSGPNVGSGGYAKAGIAISPTQTFTDAPPSWPAGGTSVATCVISNNIIKRQQGDGIRIAGRGAEVVIDGNIIYDTTGYFIRSNGETPVEEEMGHHTISNNRLIQRGEQSIAMVRLWNGTSVSNISNNYFECTGTFSGISPMLQVEGEEISITGNRFKGVADAGFLCRGITLSTAAEERFTNIAIANNTIETCAYGMTFQTTAAAGPVIINNNCFTGCTRNILQPGSTNPFYGGSWSYPSFGDVTSTNDLRCVVYNDQVPNNGTWLAGDIVFNIAAVSGQPMGWICTTGGPYTTAVFTPMANIP